jgi:site-specific recombinase XerD
MLREYQMVFRLLFLDSNVIPSDLATYTSQNFKRLLGDNFIKRNWSSATYNTYRKCFKCYCGYLTNEEFITENPFNKIPKRKEPQQLPKALNDEQVTVLLNALTEAFDKDCFLGLRNITMVYTFLHTGLRLSELTHLKYCDLRLMD